MSAFLLHAYENTRRFLRHVNANRVRSEQNGHCDCKRGLEVMRPGGGAGRFRARRWVEKSEEVEGELVGPPRIAGILGHVAQFCCLYELLAHT
ncbi:hypothetical protein AURDEDRAFT_167411 [Auricularia subglabra TFB-10046 SS5]|nr:hypothetical protein AURDEDRAFT_167411 [Auricularia subglabra TFB-10046 SS5]